MQKTFGYIDITCSLIFSAEATLLFSTAGMQFNLIWLLFDKYGQTIWMGGR
jgi:hypothetical protein